jgi:hypothetical protein
MDEERQRAATLFYISRLCSEKSTELGLEISKETVATLSCVFDSWLGMSMSRVGSDTTETYANDLESFAKHRKKKIINPEE